MKISLEVNKDHLINIGSRGGLLITEPITYRSLANNIKVTLPAEIDSWQTMIHPRRSSIASLQVDHGRRCGQKLCQRKPVCS